MHYPLQSQALQIRIPLLGKAKPCTHLTPPVSQPNVKYELAVVDVRWTWLNNQMAKPDIGHLVVETSALNIAQQPSDSCQLRFQQPGGVKCV